ncbi:MAG: helix-turn-helix domain-containing protein [Elusimicrobia bacterium]|nr:helix-turn-helix domain-containing protein [Elusimicrobiota bacterium]
MKEPKKGQFATRKETEKSKQSTGSDKSVRSKANSLGVREPTLSPILSRHDLKKAQKVSGDQFTCKQCGKFFGNEELLRDHQIACGKPKLSLEERREKVFDLKLRGLSVRLIGQVIGLPPATVYDDLEAVRNENVTSLTEDRKKFLGDFLAQMNFMARSLMRDYFDNPKDSAARYAAASRWLVLIEEQRKFNQDIGILPRDPDDLLMLEGLEPLDGVPEPVLMRKLEEIRREKAEIFKLLGMKESDQSEANRNEQGS